MERPRFVPEGSLSSLFLLPPYNVSFSDAFPITPDLGYRRKVMGVCWVNVDSRQEIWHFRCDPSDTAEEFINIDRRNCVATSRGYWVTYLPKNSDDHVDDFPTACYSAAALSIGGISSLQACRLSWLTSAFSRY